jgi:hypothetical protein
MMPPPVSTPPPPRIAPPPAPPTGPPPKKGMSGLTIGLIIGGVVLLIALAVFGWLLIRESGELAAPAREPVAPSEPAAPLPAGDADVEVTLRWSSGADLDLQVYDPEGDVVSYASPQVASGGTLDADANRECNDSTTSPVERISWGEGQALTGAYFVQVAYAVECTNGSGTQDFTLGVVIAGETVAMLTDSIAPGEVLDLVGFSFPAGIVDDWREFEDAPAPSAPVERADPAPAPAPEPAPEQVPSNVADLPSGLFCRDLNAMGFPYWDAVTYWEREGYTSRMDADGNGIPCETVYPWNDVRDYWGVLVDPDFEEGGDVP